LGYLYECYSPLVNGYRCGCHLPGRQRFLRGSRSLPEKLVQRPLKFFLLHDAGESDSSPAVQNVHAWETDYAPGLDDCRLSLLVPQVEQVPPWHLFLVDRLGGVLLAGLGHDAQEHHALLGIPPLYVLHHQ
jgi:hypothetical protein